MKKLLIMFLPLLMAGVLFSILKITEINRNQQTAGIEYEMINEIASGADVTEYTPEISQNTIDFDALKDFNPDIIAWIRIPGTVIDYPVLTSTDNIKYLRHTPSGEYNVAGSIFLECTNQTDFSDRHSVIYGHHFRGSYRPMFTILVDYKELSFYQVHPYAELFTPDGEYRIIFFSCYVTETGDDAWQTRFNDDVSFSNWVDAAKTKSIYDMPVIPTPTDRIVTLSTCSTESKNSRFVIHGILEKQ